jgi:hypothetical protein
LINSHDLPRIHWGRVILSGGTVAIDDAFLCRLQKTAEFYEGELAGIIGVPIFYTRCVGAIALVLPKQ